MSLNAIDMVTRNPLLAGARGGLGKVVVFKQMYGKTVMTNYPRKADIPREKQSAAQQGTRDNFRKAVAYAKAVLKDPVQKVYYEKKKKKLRFSSTYQAAITDYMRKLKPVVVKGTDVPWVQGEAQKSPQILQPEGFYNCDPERVIPSFRRSYPLTSISPRASQTVVFAETST